MSQTYGLPVGGLNNFQWNNIGWNNTDIPISGELERHWLAGDSDEFLVDVFPRATSITNPNKTGSQITRNDGSSSSSFQSWERVDFHNLTPSQSSKEGVETIPRDKVKSHMPRSTTKSSLPTEYSVETAQGYMEQSQAPRMLCETVAPNSETPSPRSKRALSRGIRTKEIIQKKRGKLTTEGREKAKKVRQIGACLRCRMMGVGVSILSTAVLGDEIG